MIEFFTYTISEDFSYFNSMPDMSLMGMIQNGIELLKGSLGVPTMSQWDWQQLWSTGTGVQSLAKHSGLKIHYCYSCGHNCSLDLISGLGTPYAAGQPKKKKKGRQIWQCASKDLKYPSPILMSRYLPHALDINLGCGGESV